MCNYCESLVPFITSLSLSLSPPTTGATKDMGKMLGGEEEKDPDAQKKEEERQEALRQQEEERKAKYARMEAERENIRQGIRDKVKTLQNKNKGNIVWPAGYIQHGATQQALTVIFINNNKKRKISYESSLTEHSVLPQSVFLCIQLHSLTFRTTNNVLF